MSGHFPGWCVTDQLRWTWLYLGFGALHTFGRGFFVNSPDPFPPRYYPVTATRPFLSLGSDFAWVPRSGAAIVAHSLYGEINTQDQYVMEWLDNTNAIEPWEVWSLALGYKGLVLTRARRCRGPT